MSVNNIGCSIQAGYQLNLSCNMSESGIKEFYLLNHSNLSQTGFFYDSNDLILSCSTSGALWYRYDQVFETSEYSEKKVDDSKTGGFYWDQTFTILFHKNRANLRKQLLQFVNAPVCCIIHTNDERYFLLGKERGLDLNAEIKIEKNYAGFNGQILQLKGQELFPAYEIAPSGITYSSTYITRDRTIGTDQSPSLGGIN